MYKEKNNKKSHKISVWCTLIEKRFIEIQARKANSSASEYIREMALRDYGKRPKTLPPEVLAFNGQLSHLSALLQPLARKRLDGDELNALERAELKQQFTRLQQLTEQIKTCLQ
jgi:hypothetical protein